MTLISICFNPHVKLGFHPSCTGTSYRFFNIQSSWTTVDNIFLASSAPPCIHTFISLLSVAGWSKGTKSSLMFLMYASNQSWCVQAACINRWTNSRQRTYHQPTAEDPMKHVCTEKLWLKTFTWTYIFIHSIDLCIVNSIVLTIIHFYFNPCLL